MYTLYRLLLVARECVHIYKYIYIYTHFVARLRYEVNSLIGSGVACTLQVP